MGHMNSFFWMMVISFIIASLYIPFAGPINNWSMFLTAIILNIALLYFDLKYFQGLEIGNASLVGAIAGSFGSVSALLSIIFFKETLSLWRLAGILLATAGVILSSVDLSGLKLNGIKKLVPDTSIRCALIALFGWGVYYAVVRIPVSTIGWFWTQYSWYFLFVLLFVTGKVQLKSAGNFKDKKQLAAVFLFAITMTIGVFSYNLGLTFGYTSVVAPIAATSTVLFVVFTRIVFKEKLTVQQKWGILSSLSGVLLLSFASG